ncbi:integrase and RNaseH domain-containing protein, partial [Golovinomyces cichoracearum]
VTIETVNGPAVFRSTVVKPFLRDPAITELKNAPNPGVNHNIKTVDYQKEDPVSITEQQQVQPRRRGRPRGSRNKSKNDKNDEEYSDFDRGLPEIFISMEDSNEKASSFVTRKEDEDYCLELQLRKDGIIKSHGQPFEESDDKEISELVARGVFKFVNYDPKIYGH